MFGSEKPENFVTLNIKKADIKTLDLSTSNLLAVGLIYLLQLLFVPIAIFFEVNNVLLQFMSLIAFISAYAAYSKITNDSKSLFPIVLSVILCLIIGPAVIPLAIIVSLIFSVCTLSYIFGVKNKTSIRVFFALIPVISWLIASVLLKNLLLSAIVLFHIPAAFLLAYAIHKGTPRVSSICRVSVGMILSIFAIAATYFFLRNGTDIRSLPEFVANSKESLTNFYYGFIVNEYLPLFPELSAELSNTDIFIIVSTVVKQLFVFLPAIVVTAANILAFFIHSITLKILLRTQKDRSKILPMFNFDMTLISAIVFLTSFLVSAVMSDGELSVLSAGMANIAIIFIPGLMYTTILTCNTFLALKPSCAGSMLYMALIFLTVSFAQIMFPLVSVAGAVIIIVANITKHRLLNKKK